MKTKLASCLYLAPVLLALLGSSPFTRAQNATADFPYTVSFELGFAEFAPGDSITITAMHGTRDVITTNETYCVEGVYTLASADEADLCFYATTTSNSGPTPVDPRQRVRVQKGSGNFRLVKTMGENGYLHLSFYPARSGGSFGGIYFGQGEWVRREPWGKATSQPSAANSVGPIPAVAAPTSASNPNQVIFDYLGDPVSPPQSLAPAYTRQGLTDAIQLAAQNAGVTLQRVEIDDSEFPFLIGVTSSDSDYEKLVEQLRKVPSYEYGGSVGGHTHHAFNLVPYHAFPSEAAQRIGHRLTLRMQIFCDKIVSE